MDNNIVELVKALKLMQETCEYARIWKLSYI